MSTSTLGVTEAATILGMTRRGVLAAIERGAIPADRLSPKSRSAYVLQRTDVEALAQERAK